MHGKRTGKTSGVTSSIKEPGQKLRRAPTAPYSRSCLSKARRQLEKKKTTGSPMEDRRKAKDCLRDLGQRNALV